MYFFISRTGSNMAERSFVWHIEYLDACFKGGFFLSREDYARLAEMIRESENTVVFTGAGISTSCGLPDFRGKSGIWKDRDPSQLASVEAMESSSDEFYSFYCHRIELLEGVTFGRGHEILSEWEKKGLIKGLITQNVDGLHQRAGSQNVAEIHGSLSRVKCRRCGTFFPASDLLRSQRCEKCGGRLRPDVVLFGEMLPVEQLRYAQDLSEGCDLFIVLGSSLQVSPANWFPMEAKNTGAQLVIVNLQETPFDDIADVVISGNIDEILEQVESKLSST